MQTQSEQMLEKIGLSKGEIKVYLAGLSLGPSFAKEIARKANISRTLIYHLLESLAEKGLVAKSDSKNRKHFTMESPSRLKSILERKQKEFEKMQDQFSVIAAELESIHSPIEKTSQVYFYKGAEGLKNVAQDVLEAKGGELCSFVAIDKSTEVLKKEFWDYWLEEVKKRNVVRRSIWNKPLSETPFPQDATRNLRISPPDVKIDSNILLYKDKIVVMSTGKEPLALVIKDKNLFNTLKSLFEVTWKISKPSK